MLLRGIANFNGDESTNLRAFCDPKDSWNGWAKPFIHCEDIAKCISLVEWKEDNGDGHFYELIGDELHVKVIDCGVVDYEEVIKPLEIEGEKYFWMGDQGLVFDFEKI